MTDQQTFARIALAAMATGLMLAGCSTGGGHALASAGDDAPQAPKARASGAIAALETAVAARPDDAAARIALAQGYAGAGRLSAARQAYADAVSLGDTSTRAVIGLALGEIAVGRPEAAIALIEAHRETLPASDAGLALALAGDTQRAVMVLGDVARDPEAGARARQNLALALALDGQWAHAKLVAGQDLAPDALRARMVEWSRLAGTSGADGGAARVASVLRLKSVGGEAMPARLALTDAPAIRTASADPAPIARYAPPPPPEMIDAEETAPTAILAAETPAEPDPAPVAVVARAEPAPIVITASRTPYRARPATPERLVVARVKLAPAKAPTRTAAKPGPAPVARVAPRTVPRVAGFDPRKPSGWAVQIGAYDSVAIARNGWARAKARNPQLAAFPASSHAVRIDGRLLYRLTINGLPSREAAQAQCRAVVARGGACFVRAMAGSEVMRWASAAPAPVKAKPTRLAMR